MKKRFIAALGLFGLLLGSCSINANNNTNNSNSSSNNSNYLNANTNTTATGNNEAVEIKEDDIAESFTLVDAEGNKINGTNGIYTITTGGTYTASGKLNEGQIFVDAANLDIELDLDNVSISNSSVSPIFVNDCNDFDLKVVKDSLNYIYDNRTTDYSQSTDDTIGSSAIYVSNGDLKIKGKGTLSVTSVANSGIHSKDNVSVKNVTMLVKAQNNGIKGNDKVTIEENPTIGIVAGNNGIITSNSDLGTNVQHGYIYINGGNITINSYGDGIDAAYSLVFGTSTDTDGITYEPTVDIYTNIYSSYVNTSATTNTNTASSNTTTTTYSSSFYGPGSRPGQPGGGFDGGGMAGGKAAEKADESAKGMKANESIEINAGNIFAYAYDDAIHTNCDELLENGNTPSALITITGGTLNLKASDDAIHADGTLEIKGGIINVAEAHEGLEGKIINIIDGNITVFGSDDGVNASTSINISGGRLDVTVQSNGDYDGIDSNGTISITGGIVITRGPNSEMAAPVDSDRGISVTGGTLIVVGYCPNLTSGLKKTTSTNGTTAGTHTVTIGSDNIEYTNTYSYNGQTTVYSSSSATVK